MQRLLIQPETEGAPPQSREERARAALRAEIHQVNSMITWAFGIIENQDFKSETDPRIREQKIATVRSVKQNHAANGILTMEMIGTLQEAVRTWSLFYDEDFNMLRHFVREREGYERALEEDPVAWVEERDRNFLKMVDNWHR